MFYTYMIDMNSLTHRYFINSNIVMIFIIKDI